MPFYDMESEMGEDRMYCPKCGGAVHPEVQYCGNCLKYLSEMDTLPTTCSYCGYMTDKEGNCGRADSHLSEVSN